MTDRMSWKDRFALGALSFTMATFVFGIAVEIGLGRPRAIYLVTMFVIGVLTMALVIFVTLKKQPT